MKSGKKLPKKIIALIVCGCIIFAIGLTALGFWFHFLSAHSLKVWQPSYAREDISRILDKAELTQEDYSLLYAQTGLTKIGIDRARKHGQSGKTRVLAIQNDVFSDHEIVYDSLFAYSCQDEISGKTTNVYFEPGDIVVSSSTHIAGFRIGHSGLVTDVYSDGASAKILQASAIGSLSSFGSFADFTSRINFMILRPKPELISDENVKKICNYASENLTGMEYFPAAGVLSKKTDCTKTQCSHLVWCAYQQYGFDLDSNGGAIVTPKDLAHSQYLELVQVFGFDFNTLWK